MTDAAPLTAQAHATSPSSCAPADAMTLGKTEPSGSPIAIDTRQAVAPGARSGHASVAAAMRSKTNSPTATTIALASAAPATGNLPRVDAADPPAAPTRGAATPAATPI